MNTSDQPGHDIPPHPNDPSHRDNAPPQRPPRRDTIIIRDTEIFDNLGIQNIPLPEFRELAQLIATVFGIKVGENKITLVTGRIHPMMEKYGFTTHRQCIDAIKNDPDGELISELANLISTNHTAFYREEAHFQILQNRILPELIKKKKQTGDHDIRVWCAACATGEEAYTILFTLIKYLNFDYRNWRAGVLATDISATALEKGRRGVYTRQHLEPVPPDIRNICFNRLSEDEYEVKAEYREEVTFRRLNLVNDTYPFRRPFDMIFCRNVMIYFSRSIRVQLLSRLREWLVPGGYLFIGHSESLVGNQKGYEYVEPAVYRRTETDDVRSGSHAGG